MKTLVILTNQNKIDTFEDINTASIKINNHFCEGNIEIYIKQDNTTDFNFLEGVEEKDLYVLFHASADDSFSSWKNQYPEAKYNVNNHFVRRGNPYYDFFEAIASEDWQKIEQLIDDYFNLTPILNFLHKIYNTGDFYGSLDSSTLSNNLKDQLDQLDQLGQLDQLIANNDLDFNDLIKVRDCLMNNISI